VFIVDLRKEQLALREAQRLGLPVFALVDTNCDPDEVTYVVPGNDDAIRSCSLVIRAIADGIEAGRTKVTEAEIAAPPKRDEPAEPAEAAAAPESDGGQPGDEAATSDDDAPVAVENGAQA
jgi:small subunit ribosomal protein S2